MTTSSPRSPNRRSLSCAHRRNTLSLRFAIQRRFDAVCDPARQQLRPLADGLVRHAYRFGCSSFGSAQHLDGFGFQHAALNHSSQKFATTVQSAGWMMHSYG